jgi:S-formylglutathione hydrolase FrmB
MIKFRVTIDSIVLYRPVEVLLALPHGLLTPEDPFPVLWTLHPAMCDGNFFFDALGIASVVDKRNLAVVAPSLGNGYFLNSSYEQQADFLNDELLPTLHSRFSISSKREDNILLGISMGGFGAMRWALCAPESFCAVVAVSGVFDIRRAVDERAKKNREQRPLVQLFREKLMPRLFLDECGDLRPEANIDHWIEGAVKAPCPRIALFCGEEDYISLNQTSGFVEKCRVRNILAEAHFTSGGHNTEYWANIMPCAIDWLLKTDS